MITPSPADGSTTATTVEQVRKQELLYRCSACGADRGCDCSAPAIKKAAAAIAANPRKSGRAIAAEIGVSHTTVQNARKQVANDLPPEPAGADDSAPEDIRIGRDGKSYPARKSREETPKLNAVGKPFSPSYDPNYKRRTPPPSINRLFAPLRARYVGDGQKPMAVQAQEAPAEPAQDVTSVHAKFIDPPGCATVASVKFMITQAEKAALRERGLTDDQIAELTPQAAADILAQATAGGDAPDAENANAADDAFAPPVATVTDLPGWMTTEEAEASYQETLFAQACLLWESMADETRQRFLARVQNELAHAPDGDLDATPRAADAVEPA
jgi:hypothetical protein